MLKRNLKLNFVWFKLLVLGLWLPAVAQAQLKYTTNSGAITITGCSGSGGAVEIPSTINGYPVTSINKEAFKLPVWLPRDWRPA